MSDNISIKELREEYVACEDLDTIEVLIYHTIDHLEKTLSELKSERDRADKAEARIVERESALDTLHEALCRKCDDTDPTEMIALACARIQSCSDLESERAEIVEACGFEDDFGDTNRPSTLVAYIAEQQMWALEKCDRTIDLMHARAWRDNLRTTKARVAELEGPHEWPSIESAPEDGTRVLIYDPKTTDACRCLVAWMGPGPHGDEEWLYWEGPLSPSFESVWTHLPIIESSDDDETPS